MTATYTQTPPPGFTQNPTQRHTQILIQDFTPLWRVQERYLSPPKLIKEIDKETRLYWGNHPKFDEFISYVDTLGFRRKDECICRKILGEWATKKLKIEKDSHRRCGFSREQIQWLDEYYRAVHLIGIDFKTYNDKVIRNGKTLDQYLGIEKGNTL